MPPHLVLDVRTAPYNNWQRALGHMAYSTGTASNMKSPPKILIVTSDNDQVTLTVICKNTSYYQCNCLNIAHQFSHRRAAIHATGRLRCR